VPASCGSAAGGRLTPHLSRRARMMRDASGSAFPRRAGWLALKATGRSKYWRPQRDRPDLLQNCADRDTAGMGTRRRIVIAIIVPMPAQTGEPKPSCQSDALSRETAPALKHLPLSHKKAGSTPIARRRCGRPRRYRVVARSGHPRQHARRMPRTPAPLASDRK
jgi:hypothetical protein